MTHSERALELYVRHRPALIEYARPLVGCPSHAEDVVQDAWLRFAAATRESTIVHPVAYLYRLVRNSALDLRRKLTVERAREAPAEFGETMPARGANLEQQALERARLHAVEMALAELPDRTRMAFDLHRFGGLTLAEVAQRLGISVTLTHRLVHAALVHCAARIGAWESTK